MTTPTVTDLATAVRSMRAAQQAFFECSRDDRESRRVCLQESKRLEREVDKLVAEALSPQQDLLGTAADGIDDHELMTEAHALYERAKA